MLDDDLSYLLEVLHIGHGETEDQLDERLRTEARELGLDVIEELNTQDKTLENRPTQSYFPEYTRRSGSIDSRASHSTGLTSTFSDISRDQSQYHEQRRRSRASLSFRDYDEFLARGVPTGRHSLSFSPLSTPSNSLFSLPLSHPPSPDMSPKKHFRRIRGLSMLKLHTRTGSDASPFEGCPHCPQDSFSQRRAVHKLPCGHRLCTQALRSTVKHATESKTGSVPSCCGRPIPGSVVEHVMTQEEQNALLDKLEQWDEAVSIAPSINSSRRESIPYMPQPRPGALTTRSRTTSEDLQVNSLSPKQRRETEKAMEREDYKLLRTGQASQRDRFLRWAEKQRQEVERGHEGLREAVKAQHEAAVEDTIEQHAASMAEAEDKQVKAEADLRETQEQEKRDNATALKHMERYCAGTYGNGEPHNRFVTEQDLAELDKARRTRDRMDSRHESQINVLRGDQGRRMRLRSQRQDRELQDLKRQQRKEELELERMCTKELAQMDETLANKQRKICWRWELQMAIFTKKVETETGLHLNCRLPTVEWSNKHDGNYPQLPSRLIGSDPEKHGISHGFTMRGTAGQQHHHQEQFKIGG